MSNMVETNEVEGAVSTPETPETIETPEKSGKALASLILGIFAIFTALLPILGLPVGITGLVLGILSKNTASGKRAKTGIILSSIGLVLTVINMGFGIYLALNGMHPLVK